MIRRPPRSTLFPYHDALPIYLPVCDGRAGSFRQELLPMLTFKDRATAPKHVLVRPVDQESVLLNLETERYFGLDETGTRMWQLLTTSPDIDAAYQELLAEYDEIGRASCRERV